MAAPKKKTKLPSQARQRAEAKRRRFLAARARGKTRAAALKKAGYRPGSARAAAAQAGRIANTLRDRGELEAALLAEGLTLSDVARRLKRELNKKGSDKAALLRLLSSWMGWSARDHDDETAPGGIETMPLDELLTFRAQLVGTAQVGGGGAGPGHAGGGAVQAPDR